MSEFDFEKQENRFDNEDNSAPDAEDAAPVYELGHVMPLSEPFSFGDRRVESIQFKNRFTVGMIKHFPMDQDKSPLKVGHFLPVISKMTGEVPQLIDMLGMADMNKAAEITASFFGSGQTTGKDSDI